jgi:hypothetical protein
LPTPPPALPGVGLPSHLAHFLHHPGAAGLPHLPFGMHMPGLGMPPHGASPPGMPPSAAAAAATFSAAFTGMPTGSFAGPGFAPVLRLEPSVVPYCAGSSGNVGGSGDAVACADDGAGVDTVRYVEVTFDVASPQDSEISDGRRRGRTPSATDRPIPPFLALMAMGRPPLTLKVFPTTTGKAVLRMEGVPVGDYTIDGTSVLSVVCHDPVNDMVTSPPSTLAVAELTAAAATVEGNLPQKTLAGSTGAAAAVAAAAGAAAEAANSSPAVLAPAVAVAEAVGSSSSFASSSRAPCSPHEIAQILEMRSELGSDLLLSYPICTFPEVIDDFNLLRFLRNQDGNVNVACDRFRKYLEMREKTGINVARARLNSTFHHQFHPLKFTLDDLSHGGWIRSCFGDVDFNQTTLKGAPVHIVVPWPQVSFFII